MKNHKKFKKYKENNLIKNLKYDLKLNQGNILYYYIRFERNY